jgi:hypothetical protein
MTKISNRVFQVVVPPLLVFAFGLITKIAAQDQEMKERGAEIKQAAATNRLALAQYTWTEQVTISLKGEQKKQ